ncbi:MAG TPA: ABC transporter permease [Chloroflexota bacterium]|nr:ABC transporter permease [Chloroflexota bacterium]
MDAPEEAEPISEDVLPERRATFTRQLTRRLLADPSAIVGAALIGLMVLLALLAPLVARYSPNDLNLNVLNENPSPGHWFGTDYLGRDMWARVSYGGRVSLPAGLGVVAIALGVGGPLGLIAGYAGRIVDDVIMRFMDCLLAFPGILLAIGIVAILGPSLSSSVIAVGVALIPGFARLARGSTLQARELDYVEASQAQGAGSIHILVRHILPNIVDPLIVLGTLSLSSAILATAALSFLGLGTQLPTSDWGTLLSNGYEHMFQSWGEVTFPGIAIIISVLGVNLLGDALSNALDARQWSG